MKILIVDDSRVIRSTVKKMLDELGHQALLSENGSIARVFLLEEKVDLILLDWNMPKMTGVEFLETNKNEKFTDAPIVMMTTENKPEKIEWALSLGASAYIFKPFTKEILISTIEKIREGK